MSSLIVLAEMCGRGLNFLQALKVHRSWSLNWSVLRADAHEKGKIKIRLEHIFGCKSEYLFGLLSNDQFLVAFTRANITCCLCRALEILKSPQEEYPNGFAASPFTSVTLEPGKGIILLHTHKMKQAPT